MFSSVWAVFLALLALDALAADEPLAGTRRGPTYCFLTQAERAALRQRVATEPWAKVVLEKEILARALEDTMPGRAALAFVATGDKRYAAHGIAALRYTLAGWNAKTALQKAQTGFAWGMIPAVYGNYDRWYDVAFAYDLLADQMTDADEQLIRRTVKEWLGCAREWHRRTSQNPNMTIPAVCSFFWHAAAIGDDAMMDWCLNHPVGEWNDTQRAGSNTGGLLVNIDNYYRDNAVVNETPVYQTLQWPFLVTLAEVAWRYDGRDLYAWRSPKGNTVRAAVDGMIDLSYPAEELAENQSGLRIANWGHGGTGCGGHHPAGDLWLTGPMSVLNHHGTLKMLYRRTKDPLYGALYAQMPAASRQPALDDVLFGRVDPPANPPPLAAPSRWLPASGIAMLRFPDSADYWTKGGIAAWLHGNEASRAAIADPRLMLHGAGRLLYPDYDQINYEDRHAVGWTIRRASRNTMIIDGKDGLASYSRARHGFHPEVKFAAFRGHPYLEGEMERAVMLTPEYLLDVFGAWVETNAFPQEYFWDYGGTVCHGLNCSLSTDVFVPTGAHNNFYNTTKAKVYGPRTMPAQHTFDYLLHPLGQRFVDDWAAFTPTDEYRDYAFPNRWTWQGAKRVTGEAFTMDWIQEGQVWSDVWTSTAPAVPQQRAAVRLHVLGAPDTAVFIGNEPMSYGPVDEDLAWLGAAPDSLYTSDWGPLTLQWQPNLKQMPAGKPIQFVAVRRTGKTALFTAVHEPYVAAPAIRAVRALAEPVMTDPLPAGGVEVVGPDYTDRLYVALRAPVPFSGDLTNNLPAPEIPVSSVVRRDDPNDGIGFRSYAYARARGDTLTVRGEVAAFSWRMPQVRQATLNGKPIAIKRDGEYIQFGAQDRFGHTPALHRPLGERVGVRGAADAQTTNRTLPSLRQEVPPLRVSFPQGRPTIAATGSEVLVRVQHVGGPFVSAAPATAGRVALRVEGLTVEPAERAFPAVAPGRHTDLSFTVRGGDNGKTYPAVARLEGSPEAATDLAVGLVIREVNWRYDRPMWRDFWCNKISDQPENHDQFLVRAPGYTLGIDKFSGTSKSLLDPDGKPRSNAMGMPFQYTRPQFWNDYKVANEFPCVQRRDKAADSAESRLFAFERPARFTGREDLPAGAGHRLRFQSAEGYELVWELTADAVRYTVSPGTNTVATTVDVSLLDIEDATYRYRYEKKDGTFRFVRKPDAEIKPPTIAPVPKYARQEWQGITMAAPPVVPWLPVVAERPRPAPVNVLSNGNFAALAPEPRHPAGQFPAGWELRQGWNGEKPASNLVAAVLEPDAALPGGRCLRFDLAHTPMATVLATRIPVRTGRTYAVKIMARFAGLQKVETVETKKSWSPGFRLGVNYSGATTGSVNSQFAMDRWNGGESGWQVQPLGVIGPVPQDGELHLNIVLPGHPTNHGTLWIGEVLALEELP